MAIKIDSYCYECLLRRHVATARSLGSEEQATIFAQRMLRACLDAPEGTPSPAIGTVVSDLLLEMYGVPLDRYHEEKIASNRFVMERLEDIRQAVTGAEDPVYAGLQMAILGNYLDYGALQGQVSFEKLEEMLADALRMELDRDIYGKLCRDFEKGQKLLYLTDNAGEIGFDRVFAEAIRERYPHLEILFCVRGDIAGNDATREDAAAVELPFPVIDSGDRTAGTLISKLGQEAKQALEEADVIIAKGMANTETMLGCGYNVYYAFLVKCQRFVNVFQKPMFTPVLTSER